MIALAAQAEITNYQVLMNSSGSFDLSGLKPTNQTPSLHLSSSIQGRLEIYTIDSKGRVLARFVPNVIKIDEAGKPLSKMTAGLSREIPKPFEVKFKSDGTIGFCRFDHSTSETTRQLLRSLCANVQTYKLPTSQSSHSFKRWEATPAGKVLFTYVALKSGHGSIYSKVPVAVQEMSSQPTHAYVRGRLQVRYRRSGGDLILSQLVGTEVNETKIRGIRVARSTTELSIGEIACSRTALSSGTIALDLDRLSTEAPTALDYRPPAEDVEQSVQRHQLGQTTTSQIVAELKSLGDAPEGKQNLTDLYLKVVADLSVHPETVSTFLALAVQASTSSASFGLITEAMASVGNPACQHAMSSEIAAGMPDSRRAEAILATLAQVKAPTAESVSFVRGLSRTAPNPDLRNMAEMVQGAFAKALEPLNRHRADSLNAQLYTDFATAARPEDQRLALAALGNSGSSTTFRACLSALRSDDAKTRAQGASSMRFVAIPVADDVLVHLLQTDSAAEVRYSAVYSLGAHHVSKTIVDALIDSLKDKAPNVRSASLQLLWKSHDRFPQIAAAVRNIADHDGDRTLREEAKRLLH